MASLISHTCYRIVDDRGNILENCVCRLRATAEFAAAEWTALLGRQCHVVVA